MIKRIFLLCCLSLSFLSSASESNTTTTTQLEFNSIKQAVIADYQSFYRKDRLLRLGSAFGAGAAVAHSNIDTEFQDWHQTHLKSSDSDELSRIVKNFGEKWLMMPLALTASAIEFSTPESSLAQWGQITARGYLLGGPIIGVTQPLTGGSRPKDKYQNAHWRPFNDDNGVSGHSFVGAVPFLALAKMPNVEGWQKAAAYAASGLAAWSRINDDAHYLSQALLGWYVAFESIDAITEKPYESWYQFTSVMFGDGVGIGISMNW